MMNTQKKIEMAVDSALLCLHKEGIFYKLYNQHAMLFTENIKPLRVKVKFIKMVNQHVYSCGFPASIMDTVKKQLSGCGGEIQETEKLVTVSGINWEKETDYQKWCAEQQKEVAAAEKTHTANLTDIEKQLVGFQIMRKTPMEAMNFIIELQEKLNKAP